MLPPLALLQVLDKAGGRRAAGLRALDMCASPGGKTSLLARLLGPGAVVLAGEPAPKRLAALRHNLDLLNIFNAASLGVPGESLPLAEGSMDIILLDPPCSGWGTADKRPEVLNLWRGDKLKPLIALQKRLLRTALGFLRPGGLLVYSTCTLNERENEEQVAWAVQALAGPGAALRILPLVPFPGFVFDPPADCAPGSLRVAAASGLGQGFYIAALRKEGAADGLDSSACSYCEDADAAGLRRDQDARMANCGGADAAEGEGMDQTVPAAPLFDLLLLPPGKIHIISGRLYFRHIQAPPHPWRGFFMGKAGPDGLPLPGSGPRGLLPGPEQARENGGAVLRAENPATVLALLSGQSLSGFMGEREAGLYYKDLPLARLKCRGGRAFL